MYFKELRRVSVRIKMRGVSVAKPQCVNEIFFPVVEWIELV